MKRYKRFFLIPVAVLLFFSGCTNSKKVIQENSARHMVIGIDNKNIQLHLGSNDGALIDKEYKLYKYLYKKADIKFGARGTQNHSHNIQKIYLGIVRITKIPDINLAYGVLISGTAEMGAIIEID